MNSGDRTNLRPAQSSNQEEGIETGDSVDIRHERQAHLPGDAESATAGSRDLALDNVEQSLTDGETNPERRQIIQQTVNAVLQEIHLHAPMREHDLEILSRMRTELPEFYEQHIENMRAARELEDFETRSRYEVPAKYARRGQMLGLAATLATLGVVVLAILNKTAWVAAVLGTIDLIAIAAVFGSNQKPNER